MGKIRNIKLIWFFCAVLTIAGATIGQPARKASSQTIEISSQQVQSQTSIDERQPNKKIVIDDLTLRCWFLGGTIVLASMAAILRRIYYRRSLRNLQQIERALRESEARYRAIIEDQTELICRFLPDGTLTFVNDAYCRYFHKDKSELIDRTFLAFIPEEDRAMVARTIASISPKQPIITYEHRVLSGETIRWHQWTDRAIFDARGKIVEYQAVGRDITSLKIAEAEIRQLNAELEKRVELRTQEVEENLKQLKATQIALEKAHQQLTFHVENTPLAVIEWDEQCRVKYWSPQAAKIFGWPEKEVLGLNWHEWKFIYEPDYQEVSHILSDLIANKKPRNFYCNRNYTKAGNVIYCEWYNSILQDATGKLVSILSLALDVSDRKKTEAILERQKELLQSIVDNIPIMICFLNPENGFQWVNREWERVLGWKLEEMQGFDILKQCYPNPEDYQAVMDYIQAASGTWADFQTKIRDGRILDTSWANIRLSDGSFIGIGQDITERKRAGKALAESEGRFRRAITDAPLPIMIHAEDGEVIGINHTWTELTGYTHAEIPTIATWTEKAYGERQEMLRAIIDQLYDLDSRIEEGEFIIRDAGGKERIWNFSSAPLGKLPDGRRQVISMAIDVTERKEAEQRLRYDALHDALTGLPNRVLLMQQVEQCLERAKRYPDYLFALLFVDLDRFKVVNDSLGHLVGDRLLVAIAYTLKDCVRSSDTISRLGGDEFIILLDYLGESKEAVRVAQRICQRLELPFTVEGQEFFITASIGITFNCPTDLGAIDLLRNADLAMYRAKENGKARYAIFDPEMHVKVSRQLELETNLRVALDRREFLVHYQPIVSLQTLTPIGFEALVRWQHPQQGLISPSEFIPIAEETGLIVPLGEWVLKESCRQLKAWQQEFPQINLLQMNVNLSSRQLQQVDLIQTIDSILARTGLCGSCLKLEITESLLMENPEIAIKTLLQLRERRIQISIDDFGTGYSSLSYLHRLPVDTLKIDRSFVGRMSEEGENLEIVEAIINLAHHLGVNVVAEGVETQEHFTKLQELGCESGQGYFFSRPMDAQNMQHLLHKKF
jgi:diguanylate cyclase (GGDEF)-like protein/PAS domain S-box-containing protein